MTHFKTCICKDPQPNHLGVICTKCSGYIELKPKSVKRDKVKFVPNEDENVSMQPSPGEKPVNGSFEWFENISHQPDIVENDLRVVTLPVKVIFKWEEVVTDYDEETGYTEYGQAWVMHVLPQKMVYNKEKTIYLASTQKDETKADKN